MTILVRPLGYTGKLQQLVWSGPSAIITAYAWAGGGGGGGADSNPGGQGSGGGFAQGTFRVVDGDIIQVAVGGSGKAGGSGAGAAGGFGGYSYIGSENYYGGIGGDSGPSGRSGAGGGGGGASVILLNGVPSVIAGGGAGAGGGGNTGEAVGQSAPGAEGYRGQPNGGDGTDKTGDGGGGGAGGGGLMGGQGGDVRSGDQGGLAGFYGSGLGNLVEFSSDREPANKNSYYAGTPGVGGIAAGNGTAGYVSLEFDIGGIFVNDSGTLQSTKTVLIKQNNVWNTVQSAWIKQEGIWQPVAGSFVPTFTNINGNFGGPSTTCISVIDETSRSSSTIAGSWNSFLDRNPETPLYLLQPGGPSRGSLKVPSNFTSSGQGFGPTTVNRDNGRTGSRSDWFSIANLSSAEPGSIVELAIDGSGSMDLDTVRASYDYFIEQCKTAGIKVIGRTMKKENWAAPFS